MSNYTAKTYNPHTGTYEDADWIDDYFGRGQYGIKYKSDPDTVYRENNIKILARHDEKPVFEEEK